MAETILKDTARAFIEAAGWSARQCEPLTGDASARKYFRLRKGSQTAVLMDASEARDAVAPFLRINAHLQHLGFSVPTVLARDEAKGLLLLEDFGDGLFADLLDKEPNSEKLFTLGTDVLIALHREPRAIPDGLRAYDPEKMLSDLEPFLHWRIPNISERAREEFHNAWREVLPLAHKVPCSLLLRDYHVGNLMFLPQRTGVQQAGLLDFQDAYQGPVTYDLISLLEDARRDIAGDLKDRMIARYLAAFPSLDPDAFASSAKILAALRHTRVLAIFERLSKLENKPRYKELHSPRVANLLQAALNHPALDRVKRWMDRYAE